MIIKLLAVLVVVVVVVVDAKYAFIENDTTLVKTLFKTTKRILSDVRKRNQDLVKRIEECNRKRTQEEEKEDEMNSGEEEMMMIKNDVMLLYSTMFDDMRIYFTELERNAGVIEQLKNEVSNLTIESGSCRYVETPGGGNRSVKYKRTTDCYGLNLTGIVLVEYENANLDVYCENNWLLIQRRQHGYGTNFNRSWLDYKNGFGSLRGEFYLGNEIIHKLTNAKKYQLRIELIDWSDNFYVADYDYFRVDNEDNFYRLLLSKTFRGNTSKDLLDDLHYGLSAHNNAYFQTYDHQHKNTQQQQQQHKGNCASKTGGAWWFLNHTQCLPVNLNGVYVAGASSPPTKGIKWLAMNNHDKNYSLKKSKMKIKPIV